MPSILVGGDVCPIGPNEPLFVRGLAKAIFKDLLPEFERADFRVVNLECPLVTDFTPIRKFGPALAAAKHCVNGLKAAGIDAVNLANNHILDQGEKGLRSTLEACAGAGIGCFGAGANLAEAGKVFVREINGLRIGFYGIVDKWVYCLADAGRGGANPLDFIEIAKVLRENRSCLDFLVVLLHVGSEHHPYPSPGLRRLCRFLVDEGAGAVICQHSHCPGCYEFYEGAPIVYGQGNFVFLSSRAGTAWNEGFLVRLEIKGRRECGVEWVPCCQNPGRPGTGRMPAARVPEFLAGLEYRSQQIHEEGFLEQKWTEFCQQRRLNYYHNGLYHHQSNWLLRAMSRSLTSLFGRWLHPVESRLRLRNLVQPETFREELLTILGAETDDRQPPR